MNAIQRTSFGHVGFTIFSYPDKFLMIQLLFKQSGFVRVGDLTVDVK